MTIFDQMCECCCDKTMAQDTRDRMIEPLKQQIADLQATEMIESLKQQIADLRATQMAQAAENVADLRMYHAGLTEVIDVEPIDTREGPVYMRKPTASDIEGYMWKQMIEEAER